MTDVAIPTDKLTEADRRQLWIEPPAFPRTLGSFVVCWNRPHFLRRTLGSLSLQMSGLDAAAYAVDNASDELTRAVIAGNQCISGYRLLPGNRGINGALEAILPADLPRWFRYVLVSDADMLYRQPLELAIELLEIRSEFAAVSYQHSPEHAALARFDSLGHRWLVKSSERGCALIVRAELLQAVRPLPVERMVDFDWWLIRDAPHSLQSQNCPIAVLPGAAHHLGWRRGDSTWQTIETPEFDEFKE